MKHFPILQGKAHVVELPEGATNLQVVTIHQGSKSFPSLKYDRPDLVRGYIDLPPGTWQIVGMLPEVTEEEAAGLVTWDGPYNFFTVPTMVESLESAILAEGYAFQSTPKPENKDFYWGYLDDLAKWEADQQRVLSRERWLLLRRVDL